VATNLSSAGRDVRRRAGARRVAVLVGALLVAAVAGGCSGGPATPDDPVLAQGQQIYLARCASCHGASGGGGLGPRLAGRMTERFPDIGDQVALVTNGVRGTNMRAFGDVLSPEEIDAVVRYTREAL
jgi:mono/diheme cytochrome c family protein